MPDCKYVRHAVLECAMLHALQNCKDTWTACRQVQAGKPWFEGCLTGVGDCAHATRPDLGQGGAMAIEVSLTRSLLLQLLIA